MGFRFRRSFKLAPGVRMNFSKGGIGMSMGPRGASVSMGPRGVFGNVGIPGTGLSYRSSLSGGKGRRAAPRSQTVDVSVRLLLQDDGNVIFCDDTGAPLSPRLEKIVKRQQGTTIRAWLQTECEKFSEQLESLDKVHLATPPPEPPLTPTRRHFELPPPNEPLPKPLPFLARFFRRTRERIDEANAAATADYHKALREWTREKEAFHATETQRLQAWELRMSGDLNAMQHVLESRLTSLTWPRETNVSFEIQAPSRVWLDVDLPEVEDVPTRTATVPARGWRLSIKPLSDRRVRELYMRHVHAVGIRLAGEVFATLPTVETLTLSAYSQRRNPASGAVEDQYLYSAEIERAKWRSVNFDRLELLDPVEALGQFNLRRDLSRTGVFRPIAPING